MWTSSERWRLPRAVIAFAAIQVLALAAMLALTAHGSSDGGARERQALAMPPARVLPPSELDTLRADSTLGDPEAGRLLVAQLLDRYERSGDTDDLFEAVQWIDRDWDSGHYQMAGLATRVFERHCGHKVLRWHWLCDAGE